MFHFCDKHFHSFDKNNFLLLRICAIGFMTQLESTHFSLILHNHYEQNGYLIILTSCKCILQSILYAFITACETRHFYLGGISSVVRKSNFILPLFDVRFWETATSKKNFIWLINFCNRLIFMISTWRVLLRWKTWDSLIFRAITQIFSVEVGSKSDPA